MNVLIADFDFFSTSGGGQTYYRTLVKRNPGANFFFFTRSEDEAVDAMARELPSNAHPVVYRQDHRLPFLVEALCGHFPGISKELIYAYGNEAINIAFSVSGRSFDIADIPSFRPIHPILPALFKFNDVKCEKLVLSIHGWMQKAMDLCWERSEALVQSLRLIEQACLETSDIRYEISKFNLLNTQHLTSKPISYYDIHNVLEVAASFLSSSSVDCGGNQPPDIWHPARLDRQKGVDLFLEIVARLPRHLYRSVHLCGPDGYEGGSTWMDRVSTLAESLGIKIAYHGTLRREEMFNQVFTKRNYCIFPSRYDSFGLAVIEALSSGCPAAVSNQCGASHFLTEEYPGIPFTLLDINDLDGAAQKIAGDLMRYTELRNSLVQRLVKNPFKSWTQDAVLSIYRTPSVHNQAHRSAANKSVFLAIDRAESYEKRHRVRLRLQRWIRPVCPPFLRRVLRQLFNKYGLFE